MKLFFTTLLHIELIDLNGECIEIMPGLEITDNPSFLKDILTTEDLSILGHLEYNHISNSSALLFFKIDDDIVEQYFKKHTNLCLLDTILYWVYDFLKNSWILKDNAVIYDSAYLIDIPNNIPTEYSSRRPSYIDSFADCSIRTIKFSKEEILHIKDIHDNIEGFLNEKDSSSRDFAMNRNFSRIGRCLFFIKSARESRNIGHRIFNYCSALESLFSTDDAEISHKVAERTAFFLQSKLNKIETYKLVKTAYGIRSKFTHGTSIKDNLKDRLFEISKQMDDLLRTLITEIILDKKLIDKFESNNKELTEYFEDLLFRSNS